MNIVFIGSQPIGHDCLNEIIKMKINIKAVFTFKPDIHEKWEKSVEEVAKKEKIPLYFSEDLTTEKMRKINPELVVVIGYLKIFTNEILDIPKFGVVGIHASLLPNLRGQAPLNWAIILNHAKTGATLFKMNKGIDLGDIIDQKEIIIELEDDIHKIKNKIKKISVELISNNILKILTGTAKMKKQSGNGTYGCARIPDDGKINWSKNSFEIYNLIRASEKNYPAFTFLKNKKLYIIKAELIKNSEKYYGIPGQVGMTFKDGSVLIVTGDGVLEIIKIKDEKNHEFDAKVILNSSKLRLG